MFKINQLNPSFSISDMITQPKIFEELISNASPTVTGVLNDSTFIETKATRKIQTVNWPKDENIAVSAITFRMSQAILDEKGVQECIDAQFPKGINTVRKAVTVRMADIRWFMRDRKQFLRFCELLNCTQSDSIFGTDYVNHVMHEFWQGCYQKLFYLCFIPYMLGLVSFLLFIHKVYYRGEFDPDAEQPSHLIE